MTSRPVDVAIIGAGPYGLSLAAHLRARGVDHRVIGRPMDLWRSHMPAGMLLKSQPFASNLSDPGGTHTLEAFCRDTGRPYTPYGTPVPLDVFVEYGSWFQHDLVPEVDDTLVTNVSGVDGHFNLSTRDGGDLAARRVVVAVGVQHFPHVPAVLAGLPPELLSHTSAHTDLGTFAGRDVIVVGAGQSALESSALLRESGARVRVVARAGQPVWNGDPVSLDRGPAARLREPISGLGSGWTTWFYSRHPELFRHLPRRQRSYRARTALGPAGANWLRPRVEGQVPVLAGYSLLDAEPAGDGVRLRLRSRDGDVVRLHTGHVLAATGYRTDLDRLSFLDGDLRRRIRTMERTPAVDRFFMSSVPGVHFIGPAVAPTFGPVMRFVYGTQFAAGVVSDRLAATSAPAAAGRRPTVVEPVTPRPYDRPHPERVGTR